MQNENIRLSLPVNAAYVSAARLTASSIANRLAFGIDEIEDIKVAVSEACTYIIKRAPVTEVEDFRIMFAPGDNRLTIQIRIPFMIQDDEDEMGLVMIKASMDDFALQNVTDGDEDGSEMKMTKLHKEMSFD